MREPLMKKVLKNQHGQSSTEYLLICLALIVSMGVLATFDGGILDIFNGSSKTTIKLINLPY
ncbi:MAG: hypothetical protein KC493_01570 [Bacteriovoracaceae bacterium]|nr:hypothetical protein [Bacteriovoracaceae bacterium]